jgi:hypothetical protein
MANGDKDYRQVDTWKEIMSQGEVVARGTG